MATPIPIEDHFDLVITDDRMNDQGVVRRRRRRPKMTRKSTRKKIQVYDDDDDDDRTMNGTYTIPSGETESSLEKHTDYAAQCQYDSSGQLICTKDESMDLYAKRRIESSSYPYSGEDNNGNTSSPTFMTSSSSPSSPAYPYSSPMSEPPSSTSASLFPGTTTDSLLLGSSMLEIDEPQRGWIIFKFFFFVIGIVLLSIYVSIVATGSTGCTQDSVDTRVGCEEVILPRRKEMTAFIMYCISIVLFSSGVSRVIPFFGPAFQVAAVILFLISWYSHSNIGMVLHVDPNTLQPIAHDRGWWSGMRYPVTLILFVLYMVWNRRYV